MEQMGKNKLKKFLSVLAAAAVLISGVPQTQAAVQEITPVKPIVIVLDPGHGGGDAGATRKWYTKTYREKDANLAIAKACKKKLEKYMGVKVYLTRTSDYYVTLENRVAYAKKNGADLFVSLHNNAAMTSKTKGACVYYPNTNLNAKIGIKGKNVAQSIQSRLVGLGLKNNGVLYRNSANNSKYSDKSLADYYSVIRNSKKSGFPGLIVEHAYISNASDCTRYLGSNRMLTKLGEADAAGIASYYGLIPKTSVSVTAAKLTADNHVQLSWKPAANVDGYCVYRREEGDAAFTCIKRIKGAQITSYTDNTNVRGVSYEYGVGGYHAAKNATTYTTFTNMKSVLWALPVPQNVCAQQGDNGSWTITWDVSDTNGVSGYRIELRTAGEEDYEEIAELSDASTGSYTLDTQDLGGNIEISVCSYYEDEDYYAESDYSKNVSIELPQ